jgi:hypothetical protein
MSEKFARKSVEDLPRLPGSLREHAEFACAFLQKSPRTIDRVMRKHQLALADRQCRMSCLSGQIQDAVVILCTSLYAARQSDEVTRDAADCMCRDLTRKLGGRSPSDRDFRAITRLGERIVDGGFRGLAGLDAEEIMMRYDK